MRGGGREPARLPAPGAALIPQRLAGCPGAVAAAVVVVAAEGACVCARPAPLQHLCIKMCSSLSRALLTGWLGPPPAALWGPGDGLLLPPPTRFVPTLPALPHLLSSKDLGASQGTRLFHNAWAARAAQLMGAVWPACPPSPPGPSPTEHNSLSPQKRPIEGGMQVRAPAPGLSDEEGGVQGLLPRSTWHAPLWVPFLIKVTALGQNTQASAEI